MSYGDGGKIVSTKLGDSIQHQSTTENLYGIYSSISWSIAFQKRHKMIPLLFRTQRK